MSARKTTAPAQQPGDFDPAFNHGNLLVIPGDITAAIAIDSRGKIYIAGAESVSRGGYTITSLNPDGSRNQDFNNGESVTDSFIPGAYSQGLDIQVLSDGKIFLAGLVADYATQGALLGLARYNIDGKLDQSFGVSGHLVPTFSYPDIHLASGTAGKGQPPNYIDYNARLSCLVHDGNIYVAMKGIHNRKNVTLIMHFDENGYFIKEFGNGGTALIGHPDYHAVLAQTLKIDQHLYLAGYLGDSGRSVYRAWARLLANGELDTDFGISGFIFDTSGKGTGEIDKLVLQENSRLLGCGGTGSREALFTSTGMLTSINQDGTQDMEFNKGEPVLHPIVENKGSFWSSCAIQPDNRIVTCGRVGFFEADMIVGRYRPNGEADTSFNGKGWKDVSLKKEIGRVAMALQHNNAIVVAGHTDSNLGNTSFVFQLEG